MGDQAEKVEFVLVPDELVVLVVFDHETLDEREAATERGDVDDYFYDGYF